MLYLDDVEPTNNGSERNLRNSVIHRKATRGCRSGGPQAGVEMLATWPAGTGLPLRSSWRNMTTVSEAWFAASGS